MDEDVGTGVGPSERAQHAGGGGSTPERRRRMSARRKQDAVLRLLDRVPWRGVASVGRHDASRTGLVRRPGPAG